MPTAPPSITALPSAPDPNNRSTFNALAYPWSAALPTFGTEVSAVATNVKANADEAQADAVATAADRVQTGLDVVATAADRVQTDSDRTSATNSAAAAAASAAVASAAAAFVDTNPVVKGSVDATKQVRFEVDGLTTATTRVLTVPDADLTLVGADTAQTLTNKTLTSPTLSTEAVAVTTNNLPALHPSLNLDFANGRTVDPRITFTRASTATRVNSKGLIETVASGVPRIDYDPVTLACKGFLIEEARTNLLTYSEQFDNAVWGKSGETVTANAIAAPDGTTTADKLVESAANALHYFLRGTSGLANSTFTHSVFVKEGGRSRLKMQFGDNVANVTNVVFDLASGTVVSTAANNANYTNTSGSITSIGAGWYRCAITTTRAGLNTDNDASVFITDASSNVTYTGDGTSGLYIWGAQLEAGSFATSYIPTTSAQVTRAADVASMTGTNFSSWYRQDEGSFVVTSDQYSTGSAAVQYVAFEAGDGTNNNLVQVGTQYGTTSFQYLINTSSVGQVTITSAATTAATTRSLCYKLNDCAQSINGATVSTDTSATMPAVSILGIGNRSNNIGQINGHIARIAYYPKRLTNVELQALSA